jgi:predicted RND superfamily exporter protein
MDEPKWMTRLENRVGGLAVISHRNPIITLLAVLAVTGIGFWGSTKLTLNADLTGLLPRSFQSVRDLDELQKRFGGIGYVVVVGEGAEPGDLRRFASDMAPQLEKLEGIRFVEYQRATLFFRDRAAYYMALADLEEIDRRMTARKNWEVARKNPLILQLDGDEEPAPPLDFSDIEAKYRQGANARLAGDEPFYIDEEKKMVMLLLKPEGLSVDLGFAKELSERVRSFIESKDLSAYPHLKISYTGTFQKKIDQQEQITRDVATASSVAFALILLYLAFHFRGLFGVGYVLVPVGAGLFWTYGLVALFYGQVNILTAFLGAILGGLGTEHGLHLVGRYVKRRGEGMGSEEATKDAFSHSGGSALISSLVGSITFMSLAISEFRAFREFGVIAGFGMVVVVVACLVTIPALIGLATRFGWKPRQTKAAKEGKKTPIALAIVRFARPLAIVASLSIVILACLIPLAHFDFDFEALQDSNLPSYKLNRELKRIQGYSQTPVALLSDKPGEERFIVEQVLKRKAELGDMSTVDFVGSLEDLVPEQQLEKRAVLEKIGQALDRFDLEELEPRLAKQFDDFVRMSKAMPFAQGDIPVSVRRQFEGVDGREGGFVFIYPSVDTSDGQNVLRIAREARDLRRADGSTVSAAGENMILADILEMVYRESYWVLAAAIFFVILALWLTLGRLRTALICLTPTILSVVALVGLLPLVGLRLNILNIIALPVLIGTTVDGAVHLYSRFQEWEGRFEQVYSMTGRAIIGGLITSAVGFGAMIIADHPGLRSLGALTVMGFGINAIIMLFWFPACLILLQRKGAK